MHSALAVSLLLLAASAVVAIQVAEVQPAAAEHSGQNNVVPSDTDASKLSDEEVAAEVESLSDLALEDSDDNEEQWHMYGQYCGPG